MIEELPAFASFVSNEKRDSLNWQPTQGALVGRHPLMAADEWGASRATGVRVGRMQGLYRWGLIWLLPHPHKPAPLTQWDRPATDSPSPIRPNEVEGCLVHQKYP